MIPADLASRLRLVAQDLPTPPQPATPVQQLTDVLSELSTGQKIMAEIQSMLPNGTYRAIVAQRNITLALPFSAKAGDTLELEVVESDGKLTLAFVANRTRSEAQTSESESVSTTLSKTGNLIGNLLGEIEQQGGKAKPAALNANQPLVKAFPENASDLVPVLKESLSKSGMFYEAHQARWLEGKLATASLLQEPQGRLSSLLPTAAPSASDTNDVRHQGDSTFALPAETNRQLAPEMAKNAERGDVSSPQQPRAMESPPRDLQPGTDGSSLKPNAVAADLTPLVQQQLNALATQTYVWQGQIWPGQVMHWEITEDDGRPRSGTDDAEAHWKTRLKLDLPNLGAVEARLALGDAGRLALTLTTDHASSQQSLQAAREQLQGALEAAGLKLNNFTVNHGKIAG